MDQHRPQAHASASCDTADDAAGTAAADDTAHRCRPPRRAQSGTEYVCWCGRRWRAEDSITVRGGTIAELSPDWRFAGWAHRTDEV